ncbi:MAG: 4a-hydroxytetrahydrobiopterin dehydratase [Candidatus Eisenbacteria bacterium]|nr:4a-hydroxytetrahydrobiopterin dehydratase [Candidatus Eisenbacteria bacterium]MCC7142583.1 4a-hydroxytetrahydrobiopterin dehydratase [Candidatus Eisenbacteria bacterium]
MERRRLSDVEIDRGLSDLDGWELRGQRLHREYRFRDFPSAMTFMNTVAVEAEALDHHPNWNNVHARVEIELWTHDRGGVTEFDLELARRCARIAAILA